MYKIAIVGATGLVGSTILKLLETHDLPIENLTLLASSRSAGMEIAFKDELITVRELNEDITTEDFDYVLCRLAVQSVLTSLLYLKRTVRL